MRSHRRLSVFGQESISLGVPLNNPYPFGTVEREMWDAEYIPYNCTEALQAQAAGLSMRDPICPKPITAEEEAYWRSQPWGIRKAIPKWMIGEWLAYYGPIDDAQRASTGVGISSLSAADISYPAYLMRVCGINRLYNNTCYGPDFDIGAVLGTVLKSIAKIVSFIPGVGTVAASILAGAGALIGGENIGAAAIEAAANAVPGGGIAKDAVLSAAKTAQSLVEGKDAGTAILDGARKALERQGVPTQVLNAFDVGVALGTGKGLQEAGFRFLKYYVPGNDVFGRATEFIDGANKARQVGATTERFLTTMLSRDVYKAVGDSSAALSDDLLTKVARDPKLREMGSFDLAKVLGVAEPVARSAQVIGQYGYVNTLVRDEIVKTTFQRTWEKYGPGAYAKGPLNKLFTEALQEKKESILIAGMTRNPATTFAEQYRLEYQMGTTANRLATGGLGSPLNPGTDAGIRVQLDGIGADAIAKGPASFAYKKAKLANDVQKRTFNIGIGALVQGKWTSQEMDYWMRQLGSDQFIGWLAAKKIWGDNILVHPDVRVQLQAAGAAISAADPVYAAARKTTPGANGQRGFDIAMGQLLGHTGYDVELESVRNTIDHDPELRSGFDTAVAVVRGRQNTQIPSGMNASQAAGFLTTEGLKGNPNGAIKTSVMSNVASDAQAREGAKAQMSFFDKVLDFLGLL